MLSLPNRIIRINSLFLLSTSIPLIISLAFSYSYFKKAFGPLYSFTGKSYFICPLTYVCHTYSQNQVDHPDQTPSFLNYNFQTDVILAKSQQLEKRKLFYFFSLPVLIYIFLTLFVWFKNRIVLKDNLLSIHSLLPSSSGYRWATPRYATVSVDQITAIKIVTTTPLIPSRTDISQVNWRDQVHLSYQSPNVSPSEIVIELFIFPGFKKVLQNLVSQNSTLPITFTKNTPIDNLKNLS